MIVDTSNEIGGDGDIPHSGIGRARRMQVPNVHLQHDVSSADCSVYQVYVRIIASEDRLCAQM